MGVNQEQKEKHFLRKTNFTEINDKSHKTCFFLKKIINKHKK